MKDFAKLINDPSFNASLPLAIYIHGFQDDTQSFGVLSIRDSYVNTSVITVDWSYYASNILYKGAVIPQLKIVTLIENLSDVLKAVIHRLPKLLLIILLSS
jgi:hypothetical protein